MLRIGCVIFYSGTSRVFEIFILVDVIFSKTGKMK